MSRGHDLLPQRHHLLRRQLLLLLLGLGRQCPQGPHLGKGAAPAMQRLYRVAPLGAHVGLNDIIRQTICTLQVNLKTISSTNIY